MCGKQLFCAAAGAPTDALWRSIRRPGGQCQGKRGTTMRYPESALGGPDPASWPATPFALDYRAG